MDFSDDSGKDDELRNRLEEQDTDELFEKLKEADPESCKVIHKNNKKRIVRALEYFYLTGKRSQSIMMNKSTKNLNLILHISCLRMIEAGCMTG